MEETYWKQFMNTGKIEDYLQFKGVFYSGEKSFDRENDLLLKATDKQSQLKERDRLS